VQLSYPVEVSSDGCPHIVSGASPPGRFVVLRFLLVASRLANHIPAELCIHELNDRGHYEKDYSKGSYTGDPRGQGILRLDRDNARGDETGECRHFCGQDGGAVRSQLCRPIHLIREPLSQRRVIREAQLILLLVIGEGVAEILLSKLACFDDISSATTSCPTDVAARATPIQRSVMNYHWTDMLYWQVRSKRCGGVPVKGVLREGAQSATVSIVSVRAPEPTDDRANATFADVPGDSWPCE
jgi:hypothetical protein